MLEVKAFGAGDLVDLAGGREERLRKAALAALLAVESAAVEKAPAKSGNLRLAITSEARDKGGVVYVSGAAPYALFVHEGTGLFGPQRRRIKPQHKKALYWPGAAHPVKSVAGMKPNPFLDRALTRVNPLIDDIFREALSDG